MPVRSLTLAHDRLKWNGTLIVGGATVWGNTANSVEAATGPCYPALGWRFWYMSYFLPCSTTPRTLKNQRVLRGNPPR
ncbi:MAG: hypothetical protein WAK89_01720 [Candidatus Sulfotelmatobacter sp.]